MVRLKGGNEYRKDRKRSDMRLYNSTKRVNKYIRSYIKNY